MQQNITCLPTGDGQGRYEYSSEHKMLSHSGAHSFKAIYGNPPRTCLWGSFSKAIYCTSVKVCSRIVVWVNCRLGKPLFCYKVTKPNYRVIVSFRQTGSTHTCTQWTQGGDLWEVGTPVSFQLPSNHKLLQLQIWNWQFWKVRKKSR